MDDEQKFMTDKISFDLSRSPAGHKSCKKQKVGLLTCSAGEAFPAPMRQWQRISQAYPLSSTTPYGQGLEGGVELTATGIVTDLHRIPYYSREPMARQEPFANDKGTHYFFVCNFFGRLF